jgi:site-specific recombinase XerD
LQQRAQRLSCEDGIEKLRLGAKPFHSGIPYFMDSRVGVVVDSTLKEMERKLRAIGDRFEGLRKDNLVKSCDPRHIDEADVRQFMAWQKRRGLDPETQIKALCYLKQYLRFFGNRAWDELESKGVRYPKKPRKIIRAIAQEDLEAIFKTINDMEGWHGAVARGMISLYFATGVRPKEVRLAHFEDLKLDEMKFFVRHPKGEGSWGVPQDVDIIRPDVMAYLFRYLLDREKHLEEHGAESALALFPNLSQGSEAFYSTNAFQTIKREIESLSGVKFRLKDMRPTLTSMTVNGDLGMLVAMSQQLRHSNLATTQKHYASIKQETVSAKLRDAWKNSKFLIAPETPVISNLASIEKSGQGGICQNPIWLKR